MHSGELGDPGLQLTQWSDDIETVRQVKLLDEAAFLRFVKNRGLSVYGVVTGEPGEFYRRGWLRRDGSDHGGGPMFHPFRLFPIHRIIGVLQRSIAASVWLQEDAVRRVVESLITSIPTPQEIDELARRWNCMADLPILLEPVYWRRITGGYTHSAWLTEDEYEARYANYRTHALGFVETLDPEKWRLVHETLRLNAAMVDSNNELYLLLRLSSWAQRERLEGDVSGALWIRHMAETIRLAFEEVHHLKWPEEDEAFGTWSVGGRVIAFGADRPLDNLLRSKANLALAFGLFTGSVVRWYVEGDTEYFAILSLLGSRADAGIELVNLRGNIGTGRANIALKLADGLAEDRALRRFSIISFDCDVRENIKAIRRHAQKEDIVGLVTAHDPDFELSNFTVEELAEIAARMDAADGFSPDPVLGCDWSLVRSGREFEALYKQVSASRRGNLKGKAWGEALAQYAAEHPNKSDGTERPLWEEIGAALRSRVVKYEYQRASYRIDPQTFRAVRRAAET
jgi:hypothetical protein